MYATLLNAFHTLNGFLTAGIAITAFSLLLYALSFNLNDRAARSFAMILLCVVFVFTSEAIGAIQTTPASLEFWMRLQWVGIIFLPAAYLHLSDAVLATTGKPSRGRRRLAVRLMYVLSCGFLLLLPTDLLVGPVVQSNQPAPHLQRTTLTWIFSSVYLVVMLFAWSNFRRAYLRTVTRASRRRMGYLFIGSLAPALGCYPYLLFGSGIASLFPLLFWIILTISNLLISVLLVLMAYAVAFFGVAWPDRVIKRRLLKWILRGPVTASTVLTITTLTRRSGQWFGLDFTTLVPVVMAGSILVMEHLITLAAPVWERRLFFGRDRADMDLLQTLDERLLTISDLQQFLESILAAVCDRMQTSQAFIATLGTQELEMLVTIGGESSLPGEFTRPEDIYRLGIDQAATTLKANGSRSRQQPIFTWRDYWLAPLYLISERPAAAPGANLIGLLGMTRRPDQTLDEEQLNALAILAGRAALAIGDRFRQQQAFNSLEALTPQMDMIQRLRAASRYDGASILADPDPAAEQVDLSPWVKDALTHYWGGPKLTENPLLNLQIVQQTARENDESPANALRAILRKAIDHVRPEGERRFTGEWILYNILDMKFMEGRKVREIAMRLAVSEADLYRKQRVAIEAVARAINEMEQQARQEMDLEQQNGEVS